MDKLKKGAFTGSAKEGNPYDGDLGKAIAYDTYEIGRPVVSRTDATRLKRGPQSLNDKIYGSSGLLSENKIEIVNYTKIEVLGGYQAGARELARHSSFKGQVLDLGFGTGISTLELLQANPGLIMVDGVEQSAGMTEVAKYKFNRSLGQDLLSQVDNPELIAYWQDFRKRSLKYKNQVSLHQTDFLELDIDSEYLDGAFASQAMHWFDLDQVFAKLSQVLKPDTEVIWNSASHFYDSASFPVADWGFRYNDFMKQVLDGICKKGNLEANDLNTLSVPPHNFDSVRAITKKHGFDTLEIDVIPAPVDFQVFVPNHIPIFVKALVTSDIPGKDLEELTRNVISECLRKNKGFGNDTRHKYEITPMFRSVKQ